MREAVFEFELLTPAILAGADQQSAEMRIPSIRGALRWWTRLIAGKEEEKRIFGHVTGEQCQSSMVNLRLLSPTQYILPSQNASSLTGNKFDYFLWPFERGNTRGVIKASSCFKVVLKTKPGKDDLDEDFEKILWVFLLFGSLGTRSRRAYGSIWPRSVTIDGEEYDIPQNEEDLLAYADWIFSDSNVSLYRLGKPQKDYKKAVEICADFLKTFRCGKDQYGATASEWGKNDHDTGFSGNGQIYRAALGLPLTQRYSKSSRIVDYSIEDWDRFASPLHFKIIKFKDGFVPLMLVIPQYAPENGTVMTGKVKNGGNFTVSLDKDLLDVMRGASARDEQRMKELFPDAVQLAYYAPEE